MLKFFLDKGKQNFGGTHSDSPQRGTIPSLADTFEVIFQLQALKARHLAVQGAAPCFKRVFGIIKPRKGGIWQHRVQPGVSNGFLELSSPERVASVSDG